MRRKRSEATPAVLGLDLSLVTPGVVGIRGEIPFVLELKPTRTGEARIVEIRDRVVRSAGQSVAAVAVVEDFAFSRNMKSHEIGGLGYAVRIALLEAGFRVAVVPTSVLKKFACGKGNASKQEVAVGVYKRWGFENSSDDVIDAYALARCGQHWLAGPSDDTTKRVEEMVSKTRELSL